MNYSWLDRWDERRARRGDEVKNASEFALGAELGFPDAQKLESTAEFCGLANDAVADPTFFDDPSGCMSGFEREEGWIKFPLFS
mgnify:CR=1 FL=1